MQQLSQVQSGGGRLKGTEVVLLYVAPCTSVSVMNTLVLITTDETLHYKRSLMLLTEAATSVDICHRYKSCRFHSVSLCCKT